ncbi:MAG: hypothetical protein KDI06_11005 [Calditrichaeota bacterium]|nr:hypothetical protein [Calditrichota bacterium]HQU72726.1 hypothetical protein [Calditrichia bacterium]
MSGHHGSITFVNTHDEYYASIYLVRDGSHELQGTLDPGDSLNFTTENGQKWVVKAEDSDVILGEVKADHEDQTFLIHWPDDRGDLGQSGGTGGSL